MITLSHSIILRPKDNKQLSALEIHQPAGPPSSRRMIAAHTLLPSPTLVPVPEVTCWPPVLFALPKTYEAPLPLSEGSGLWLMSDLVICPCSWQAWWVVSRGPLGREGYVCPEAQESTE